MISNCRSLHPTDLHLHDVLEKATADQVIELSLERAMLALALVNVIVQKVDIIRDVIPLRSCRPCFDLKHDWVSIFVFASCVDLGAQEHLSDHHVTKVVFLSELLEHLLRHVESRLVSFQVEHEMIIEIVGVCRQHFLHILSHLEQDSVRWL